MQGIRYVTGLFVAAAIMLGSIAGAAFCVWQYGVIWSLIWGMSSGILCYKFIWLPCWRRPIREPNPIIEDKAPEWWNPFYT